jgi:transcriptional regulator with XRE-family HTH domain
MKCRLQKTGANMRQWAERILAYRKRSKISQEKAAQLFGVDVRTIRRWEAGKAAPTILVQAKLSATPVPLIKNPTYQGLVQLVETSPNFALLFDRDLIVLANSPSHKEHMLKQYGVDVVGSDWRRYCPALFQDIIDKHGGRHRMLADGFSSLSADFFRPAGERGGSISYSGRGTHTSLRILPDTVIDLSVSVALPPEQVTNSVRVTYLDEIITD